MESTEYVRFVALPQSEPLVLGRSMVGPFRGCDDGEWNVGVEGVERTESVILQSELLVLLPTHAPGLDLGVPELIGIDIGEVVYDDDVNGGVDWTERLHDLLPSHCDRFDFCCADDKYDRLLVLSS